MRGRSVWLCRGTDAGEYGAVCVNVVQCGTAGSETGENRVGERCSDADRRHAEKMRIRSTICNGVVLDKSQEK